MARIRTYRPGTIRLGAKVIISDPCYEPGLWCCPERRILPGMYNCTVKRTILKDWGDRTVSIKIEHIKFPNTPCVEELCSVGVDSGQAGFFDVKYYNEKAGDSKPYEGVNEEWYKRVCEITLNNKRPFGTIDGKGIVTDSGLGDGCYWCYAGRNDDGKIVALEIIFLDEYEIREINEDL